MGRMGILIILMAISSFFVFVPNKYGNNKNSEIINPYAKVDWKCFKQYKAALHLHTMQSDGYHMPDEVVKAYRNAGFSILAITDHDWNFPNARVKWGEIPDDMASPYPEDQKPPNFPANPTWPWNSYGAPKPEDIGMVGIQANELSFRHHMNSYFSDFDKITWISVPELSEPLADYKTSDQPWSPGSIVGEGETISLRSEIKNYVRAELIRIEGKEVYRTFTNPFGIKAID